MRAAAGRRLVGGGRRSVWRRHRAPPIRRARRADRLWNGARAMEASRKRCIKHAASVLPLSLARSHVYHHSRAHLVVHGLAAHCLHN